jgi:tetratricopeptide (TPR) repeat protein
MAKVFLSYVRKDIGKARALAMQLERSGHSVWWDRHIKGGSQFAAEIEAELAAADKVVVIWSAEAVHSRWVRDEAAVGGDSGRLVPISIDGTEPPLGFRQFQTIDFSKWKGRSSSPQWKELLQAIAAPSSTMVDRRPATGSSRIGKVRLTTMAAALAILVAALAWWFMLRDPAEDSTLVAISAGDQSAASRQVAHDLAFKLGGMLGKRAGLRLVEGAQPGASKAKVRFQVGARKNGEVDHRDLSLQSSDGGLLWSVSMQQAGGHSDALDQRAAVAAQAVLSCAADALAYRRERLDEDGLRLYLAGCTRVDDAYGTVNVDEAVLKPLLEVIDRAPHFEPAWAKLFTAEIETVEGPDPAIEQQVRRAEKLGLAFGELEAMKAALVPITDYAAIFRIYDEGIRRYPDNALLYRMRGEREAIIGQMSASVRYIGRAVELDPLSPASRHSFATALAYAGDARAAYEQQSRAETLWPESTTLAMARFRLDLRYGDPRHALMLFGQYPALARNRAQAAFLQARLNPTRSNIDRSLAEERRGYGQFPDNFTGLVQALAQFGRKDEAIDVLMRYHSDRIGVHASVLFRPAFRAMWRDPRSMAVAAHLGLLAYWKKSGRWPDFCFDPTLPYDCRKEAAKYRV